MTAAILSMLFVKSIQNSQYLLKDLVVYNGTSESMKVVFYYLFRCGIVKIIVTLYATIHLTMHPLNC
jgi:hypothetical protein